MIRLTLISLVLALAAIAAAEASHSVGYSDERYSIDIGVATCERPPPQPPEPCVGPVIVSGHDGSGWIRVDDGLTVESFEVRRRMTLRYDGRHPDVPAFVLIVRGERASLHMAGHVRHTGFSWSM